MDPTDVRGAAHDATDQSKSFSSKQIDDGSQRIGRQLGSVAHELRMVVRQLGRSGTVAPVAGYLYRGADAFAHAGSYLAASDGDRLIADLENLARRRVWALAGGALVLGFTTSRLLKTTRARRIRSDVATDSETISFKYRADGPTYAGDRETSFDESTDIGRVRGGEDRHAL